MKKSILMIISILLPFILSLGLVACNNDEVSVTQPSISAPGFQTVKSKVGLETAINATDQAGREIVLEHPAKRIVSGYYISSSACIALGLKDKLVGIEAKAANRPIYTMAAPNLLKLPSVGSAKEFNMESCIALKPDLVILPIHLKNNADTLAELGIPVILVNPESHQGLVDMITLIGKVTGTHSRANKLISYYNDELEAIAGLIKQTDEKPKVYMGGNSSYLTTAPKNIYQSSLIKSAGGINAAQDVDGDKWVNISYEHLIAMNPDIIVIPAEATYRKEDIINDVRLSDITAVQECRIYQMPKNLEAWDSPIPSATLGIRWLLCVLHEDVYPLKTLREETVSFYKEFYGVKIDTGLVNK